MINYEFNPAKAERNEEYRQKMIDLYHASISVIIGTVRDSYMLLTQGKTPTLLSLLNDEGHAAMKEIVMREPCLKGFVHQENKNILDALDEKNMPRLLEVYNPKDIESIKEQVISNDL